MNIISIQKTRKLLAMLLMAAAALAICAMQPALAYAGSVRLLSNSGEVRDHAAYHLVETSDVSSGGKVLREEAISSAIEYEDYADLMAKLSENHDGVAKIAQALSSEEPDDNISTGEQKSLEDGVWLVFSEGMSPMLFTVTGDQVLELTEKPTLPTLVKQIGEVDLDGNITWGEIADSGSGHAIPYKLVATMPEDYESFEKYSMVFHDKYDKQLRIVPSSVKVVAGDKDVTEAFEISVDNDSHVMVVSCDDTVSAIEGLSGESKVTVTYSSLLDAGANPGHENPHANVAKLDFSSCYDGSGIISTKEQYTEAFTWDIMIKKTDGNGNPIAGVKFSMSDAKTGLFFQEDGSWGTTKATFETDSNGTLAFEAVDSRDYVIEEDEAPAGYVMLSDAIRLGMSQTKVAGNNLEISCSMKGPKNAKLENINLETGVIDIDVVNEATGEDPKPPTGGSKTTGKTPQKTPVQTVANRLQSLAKTGDPTNLAIMGGVATCGLFFVLAGKRLKRDDDANENL